MKTRKKRSKRNLKVGLPPGSIVHIGETRQDPVKLSQYVYNESVYQENLNISLDALLLAPPADTIQWVEVDGIHDATILEAIGKRFSIHPLALEDIANTSQRPKREEYEHTLFVTLKMVLIEERVPRFEQVSFILKENTLITFQEGSKDVFEPIRERLRGGKGKMRKCKADYLLYTLIDAVVDNYFVIFEELGESLEQLEEEVVKNPIPATLEKIYDMKHTILSLRRIIWPLREMLNSLVRGESAFFSKEVLLYIRDVYDHVVEIIDIIENAREIGAGMIDVYLSSMSHRMNEVMKVLTVITTIFMPLTFIVGVYGMNFDHMPELHWRYGYLFVMVIMGTSAFVMIGYFKKKNWL